MVLKVLLNIFISNCDTTLSIKFNFNKVALMKQPIQFVRAIKTKVYVTTKNMKITWMRIASRHVAIAMVSVIYDHEQYHNVEVMTTINHITTL